MVFVDLFALLLGVHLGNGRQIADHGQFRHSLWLKLPGVEQRRGRRANLESGQAKSGRAKSGLGKVSVLEALGQRFRTFRPIALRYVFAAVMVALAVALRAWLGEVFGPLPPFLTLYPAVLAVATLAGGGPGVLAAILSTLLADYFFLPPYRSLLVHSPADLLSLGIFTGTNLALCLLAERLRSSRLAAAVAREKELLAVTLASIGDGVIVTDAQGRITFLNAEAQRLTGWTLAAAAGLPLAEVFKIINEESRQPVESPVEKVLRSGKIVELANHTLLLRKDGGEIPIDDSGAPVRGADGTIMGIVLVFRDFSKRRAAEEVLRESEELARISFDLSPIGLVRVDRDARFLKVNEKFCQITGYSAGELVGMRVADLTHPEDGPRDAERLHTYLKEGGPKFETEKRYVRKDGSHCWVAVTGRMLSDNRGCPLYSIGVIDDFTERKRAEAALLESHEQLRLFVEIAPAAIAMLDQEMRYVAASRRWLADYGLEGRDLQGQSHYEIFRDVPERWKAIHRRCLAGAVEKCDEDRFDRADGTSQWLRWEVRPWHEGPEHRVGGIVIFSEDITAAKQAEMELRAAKTSAEQAKAIAESATKTKDQFLAVLSHELRTPLTPVLTTMQMLEASGRFCGEDHEALVMMRRNIELEVRLIDDLLDLTRISRGKLALHMAPVDLQDVLQRVHKICESDLRSKGLMLSVEWNAQCRHVKGDAARLQQILWNLLKNSIKFTPQGGRITIRGANPAPDRVSITIADTGLGISHEAAPFIFNAFEQGEHAREFGGLGLGLAISKQMAELHGGTLCAHSAGRNKGASFTLELRTIAQQEPAEAPTDTPAHPTPNAIKRVLLVEDHLDTIRAMSRLLKAWRYEFRVADSVASGLKWAETESFDLIISDIGLPDGSGLDLIRQLLLKHPYKAIAISGYGMEEDVRRSLEAGFLMHLTKPVDVVRLKQVLDEIGAAQSMEPTPTEPGRLGPISR